ncbi:MAG TPA: hypothetical protein VFV99_17700 [Kofleriaceae bacterium]|nr:hypothetical protein [Kofleriaceae bacterium]
MFAGIPRWELITVWVLRIALLATCIALFAEQEWATAVTCFVAIALVVTPTIISRTGHFIWPIEVELALLVLVTAHMSLGYLFGLYLRVDVFDKVLHLVDSLLIGFVAFLAVYLAHFIRGDRSHHWLDAIFIFLITLGLGALWEICEFASDQLFGTYAQGSPTMPPLLDTMWDLILDGTGGVLAAVLGPIYMKHSRRSRVRVRTFAERVEHHRYVAT